MADRCKFEKYQYQVSYDSGSTWENVTPIQVRKGDVIEYMSTDCSEIETIYRWVDLEGTYLCDGNNKYTRQIREESYDNGATWYASYPTVYQQGTFVGVDEDYCADKFIGHYVPYDDNHDCPRNYLWNGYTCVYVDPIKVLKCDGNGVLTSGNTKYYDNNYRLVSCEIGDCVTSINDRVFYRYSGLTSCIIGNGVTSIGLAAFEGCSSLTSIHIPSACTKFHGYCFSACTSLTSVTIDSYVIDSNTGDGNWYYGQFSNCRNLQEVSFTNLRQGCIPPNCFSDCSALSSVTLANPTCISEHAFADCNSLTSIDLGSNIQTISYGVFVGCTSLTDIWIRNPYQVLGFHYSSSPFPSRVTLHVPCNLYIDYLQNSVWSAYKIEPISDGCLQYEWRNDDIQTSYVCVGVDKHYQQHKYVSYDGETWVMTSDVRTGSLYEANSVDCGYIPTNYKVALHLSGGTSQAIVCNGSTVLSSDECRSYSSSTISAEIGNCVTSIGDSAFRYFSGLTSCTISSSVTSIGDYVFYQCSGLTSIDIPNSVTSIGTYVFQNCSSLTSIVIPNSVTSIGGAAFQNCYSLTSIDIPSGVTSIGAYALYGCTSLTSCTIGNSVTYIGSRAFQNCSSLSSIDIPSGVTSINDRVFFGCSGLTSIDIPNSVTSIGDWAFNVCYGLTSIDIPSGVTSIGEYAFQYCRSLTSITCLATTPPALGNYAFNNTNSAPIYVPSESVNAYKTAWSSYASRIQAIP